MPPVSSLNSYYTKTDSIYKMIVEKAKENVSLTTQRDELLPLLKGAFLNDNWLLE